MSWKQPRLGRRLGARIGWLRSALMFLSSRRGQRNNADEWFCAARWVVTSTWLANFYLSLSCLPAVSVSHFCLSACRRQSDVSGRSQRSSGHYQLQLWGGDAVVHAFATWADERGIQEMDAGGGTERGLGFSDFDILDARQVDKGRKAQNTRSSQPPADYLARIKPVVILTRTAHARAFLPGSFHLI